MEKSKLGINIGILGAVMYLSGMIGGYVAMLLVAGYILIAEQNIWLRKTAVRAVVIMFTFSLLNVLIGFIPDLWSMVENLINIFIPFNFNLFDKLSSVGTTGLSLIRNIALIVLAIMAIFKKPLKLPLVDKASDEE